MKSKPLLINLNLSFKWAQILILITVVTKKVSFKPDDIKTQKQISKMFIGFVAINHVETTEPSLKTDLFEKILSLLELSCLTEFIIWEILQNRNKFAVYPNDINRNNSGSGSKRLTFLKYKNFQWIKKSKTY